jgi:hypothetical protein
MRILVGTILALFLTTPVMAQTAGPDRCTSVHNCLCKVKPGPKPGPKTVEYKTKRRFAVYFTEDSDSISASQAAALQRFLDKLPAGRQHISVIGYTDGCGTAEYNRNLSSRRAAAVSSVTRESLSSVRIDRVVGGERSSGHSADARRVDVVVHTSKSLTTKIDKIPADYYLIDASGSMWGKSWRDWQDVVNASVKPSSKVYLSIMTGCQNGQTLASVSPQGGTEIWWSYWNILDKMRPGQTLAIISDLQSNVPLSAREAQMIERKVQSKGVRVVYIKP